MAQLSGASRRSSPSTRRASRPTADRTWSWSSARRRSASATARERIPVAEVLRIAVKIGSAVETAHRAGVLHRDIKPSNILLTAYGHPVLSDFGIAATLSESPRRRTRSASRSRGRRPRCCSTRRPASIASEVWSLGATVYSLLAGRSPFEVPGGSNSSTDLMSRIARAQAPADRSRRRARQPRAAAAPRHVAQAGAAARQRPRLRPRAAGRRDRARGAADADRGRHGRLGARHGQRPGGPHASASASPAGRRARRPRAVAAARWP